MAINKVINHKTNSHGAMRNVLEYVLRDGKVKEGYVDIDGPYSGETINYDDSDGNKVRDTNIEKTFAGMKANKEDLTREFERQNTKKYGSRGVAGDAVLCRESAAGIEYGTENEEQRSAESIGTRTRRGHSRGI